MFDDDASGSNSFKTTVAHDGSVEDEALLLAVAEVVVLDDQHEDEDLRQLHLSKKQERTLAETSQTEETSSKPHLPPPPPEPTMSAFTYAQVRLRSYSAFIATSEGGKLGEPFGPPMRCQRLR